jgi:crotonobetainyl-CoA:carnitine CoA-transferase CaiB-like acyl-CoA transferase
MRAVAAGALAGIRVLDIAGPISAYCTRILTDLGADVVLVEPPEGDRLRRVPPFRNGAGPQEDSLLFSYYHAGQRAVILDFATDEGCRMLETVGSGADVIILSPGPDRVVPGWDPLSRTLSWATQDAVVCAMTPFGLSGPCQGWRATPMTSYAMGGTMIRMGPVDGPPVTIPGRQQWDEAGVHAALAVLAALHGLPRFGGRVVDISVQEVACIRDFVVERYSATGMDPAGRQVPLGIPPNGTFQCTDGPLNIAAHQPRHWEAFLKMLGCPDELSEPSLADPMIRRAIFDGVIEVIQRLVVHRSRQELVERGQRAGLPCSLQHTPTELVGDPQLVARGSFVKTPTAAGESVSMPGPGFRSDPPVTVQRAAGAAAPIRGDSSEVAWVEQPKRGTLDESGSTAYQRSRGSGPLAGVRVLSLGAFVAGPIVGQLLAELGADVAKVEARSRPEVLRMPAYALGSAVTEPSGVPNTLMFSSLNRNIRNLSLEMGTEEGRGLFKRLIASADVLIENFGTGVMERWECGFDALLDVNPRLVLTSLSGYGRTGPRANYLAYGSNISSFTALTYSWGRSHPTHSDYIAGEHAAVATVAALRHSRTTGRGIHIDVAQIEALSAIMPAMLLDASVNGRDSLPPGNTVEGSLLSGVYATLGYDGWIAVELEGTDDWNRMCSLLERDDLVTAEVPQALERRGVLDAVLTEWCASWTSHTAAHLLQRAGIAAGAVQTPEDVWRDPQLRSRGFLVELDQPDLGRQTHWANLYRFSGVPPASSMAGPRLGTHSRELLRDWLSMDEREIEALVDGGLVFQS